LEKSNTCNVLKKICC